MCNFEKHDSSGDIACHACHHPSQFGRHLVNHEVEQFHQLYAQAAVVLQDP